MPAVGRFFKAAFNFFVGDWLILSGVLIVLVLVALIETLALFANLKGASGYLLFLGFVITLFLTLRREAGH